MSCKPRITVVGVLLFMLAFGTLQALPAVSQARVQGRADSADLVAAAWDWLASLFIPHRPHTTANHPAGHSGQQKEGSQLDPNGGNH
jgi:hypothetical protein